MIETTVNKSTIHLKDFLADSKDNLCILDYFTRSKKNIRWSCNDPAEPLLV